MEQQSREEQYIEFRVQQQVMSTRLDDLDGKVKDFYELLKAHMDEEAAERRAIDKKMQWMLGFIVLNALGQGGTVIQMLIGQ